MFLSIEAHSDFGLWKEGDKREEYLISGYFRLCEGSISTLRDIPGQVFWVSV